MVGFRFFFYDTESSFVAFSSGAWLRDVEDFICSLSLFELVRSAADGRWELWFGSLARCMRGDCGFSFCLLFLSSGLLKGGREERGGL